MEDKDTAEDVVDLEIYNMIKGSKIVSTLNSFSNGAVDANTIAQKITDILERYVDRKIKEALGK